MLYGLIYNLSCICYLSDKSIVLRLLITNLAKRQDVVKQFSRNSKNILIMSDKEKPQKPTNQTDKPTDGGSTYITLNDETPSRNTTNKD